MRRLPIFLLLDVSESMLGDGLHQLEKGVSDIVATLRRDPHALETVFLSVIVFAGRARTLVPLTELAAFYPPTLPLGGGTALGSALFYLMDEIDRQVITASTRESKGDWRPIVFLLTDGYPTDDPGPALDRWNRFYRRRVNLVAVSVGGRADHSALRQLTEKVIVFDDTAPDAFARVVDWISLSILNQSRRVGGDRRGDVSLAKGDPGVIMPLDLAAPMLRTGNLDEQYAVFVARCALLRQPYVVKFKRLQTPSTRDSAIAQSPIFQYYRLETAVQVEESYFELSDDTKIGRSVNSGELLGQPYCPYCISPYGMAVCTCGGIHCVERDGEQTCPWCGSRGIYQAPGADGCDIGRERG
ncbi:MAG: VWA domain-containing protein [Magnetococcales bacterium]|nr:VWA domain-containing protein [Magnetococcales bacterium]